MQLIIRIMTPLTLAILSVTANSEPRERPFERMDRDGDGMISLEEFRSPRDMQAQRLERADKNGDGEVSQSEIEEARASMEAKAEARMKKRQERRDQFFAESDQDQNGALSAEEIRQGMFARLDTNGDGLLSKRELAQLRQLARRGPKGERRHMRGPEGTERGHESPQH